MEVSPDTMRRLAFVKYLFTLASQQAAANELTAAAAVMSLHDAVELFLVAASDQRNVPVSDKARFEDYWAPLAGAVGVQRLPAHTAMRRLNTARVAIKHKGVLPARAEIAAFQTTVASFFEDATPLLFERDFRAISLVEFVEPEAARRKLGEAEAAMAQSDRGTALTHIAAAFEMLLQHYREGAPGRSRRPFRFGNDLRPSLILSHVDKVDPALRRVIDDYGSALQSMQDALRIIAIGLDFRKYVHFTSLVPSVHVSGERVIAGSPLQDATEEEARFCFDYVVDSAITLVEGPTPNLLR